jgi:hypothetical protein
MGRLAVPAASRLVVAPDSDSRRARRPPERTGSAVSFPHGFGPVLIVTVAAGPVPNWQFCTARARQARH